VRLEGKVHKYGANIDTDGIIPGRYISLSELEELVKHCMEAIDSDFSSRVHPGDFIVATTNFGCGFSREHAPVAIKACGIACIIAQSFARIFFRNAINIGLPLLECPEVEHALGSPESPLTMKDVAKKFRNCASYAARLISKKKLDRTVQMVEGLDDVTDVGQIIRLLGQRVV